MRSISSEQLEKWGLRHIQGPPTALAHHISVPEAPEKDSLVFLKAGHQVLDWTPIQILVLEQGLDPKTLAIPSHISVFSSSQFRSHMGLALSVFDPKEDAFPSGISEKAFIHASAQIGKSVRVGPGAVIGAQTVIGDGTWIGSGAVIEANAHIGADCRIHSNVVIGQNCKLGQACEIHANTTLGSDGFGFIPQKSAPPIKIPQIGRVVLEDFVEIGANCAIDRGAIGDTVIGSGTKIDNLCHIAHNCRIGRNCLITAGFMIAGSSTIGDRFSCGGSVVVADHIQITDDVQLGGRSTVTKDIATPGAYTGYPLQPLNEGLKTLSSLRELPQLRKAVQKIRQHLNLKD